MGVGLWLSASSARQIVTSQEGIPAVRALLDEHDLLAYTINGFPYGDFHRPVVKHDVYEPDWGDPKRVAYTRDLVAILDGLLPEGATGSISTLPVGWSSIAGDSTRLERAHDNLRAMARELAAFENDHGPLFQIDGLWGIANRPGIDGVHFLPFPVSFGQLFLQGG